ncbi:DNA helicase/exodeoxyribonuclease V, beta subunit [Mycolicibacterium phlei]|uniref:RecBCD enzyme subunit RecB n=1 Tax=Mycolicibacterium phlei DSM 43239 = CCUG 21000 TaxID=1226750 RepID=A0A5N5V798_MYCPH|nr:exodeoxyribonuclease V subunit beta [Mycolicibacterium phlei]VEG08123.1 DNA helicase/exodeoxyribonuclease V, beta subunit [Mycobacteroides chelonae]AMO60000.1 RecBCD enzyme subunit RecB [Mycolicibacterium phlei]KAB7757774.1 exodeoxyribonuclease V subunit beta [Mycolicibacterium phlei DSM 43239 = CCUG 21000]KXW61331.1 exodeoxyribonuclease V subunit beta [Mycolicibacterium phlei DSM 43239 = CCUG 21000]KXW64649.1 exodeoxyribonuclease V subunit beta [Mycolicibacterium phlei DSM 43070]
MQPFDLLGPLPAPRTTTVLEASAGTGKTFALAGLVTRYVAEGVATLDQMLLITFSRAASQELRDRVRRQIVDAVTAFADPPASRTELIDYLLTGTADELAARERNLRDALAAFDAATIATTHQFCQLVLRSLGVAGDTDSGVTLVDNLDDLVTEIVDDLYLAHFGRDRDPLLPYKDALELAKEVVNKPATELRPRDPEPESRAAVCLRFANDVLAELDKRKRQRGILGYDDLLSRLADALDSDDSAAQVRMPQRWPIVMVDEFQDTDPVQWKVIDRAFTGRSTLILIGDPKQAIYAFRGGDIVTYLSAASKADAQMTLGTNWRSDKALVDRLQAVLRGAQLGHEQIVVHDVEAHHTGSRLVGAPYGDPFRLRVVRRDALGVSQTRTPAIDQLRTYISRDLAADIGALLASGATFDGRTLGAGDIAVIVETHKDARVCYKALCDAGIPAVYTGDSDIFSSDAAADWLALLEAFDQPHRPGVVRAAAATMFFGETAESLVAGGDALTDRIAETLREWASHARERGVAAIFEAAKLAGMSDRVLSWQNGDRLMTDLAHVTQLLQEAAHREHLTLPALRDWLRTQREEGSGAAERFRRLDTDAAAVQVMTVFVAKGLQFPIVYLPFAFNRYVRDPEIVLYHEGETRCLHIGGPDSPDFNQVQRLGRAEDASDDSRLMYVAMTRAQSQLVAWWAPSRDEVNGGLSRLLRGRRPGEAMVPDTVVPPKVSDDDALARFREWEAVGGPVIEDAVPCTVPARPSDTAVGPFEARHFHRSIDTAWKRTSYSGLIRDVEPTPVSSEPEVSELDDEVAEIALTEPAVGADVPSPMAELPTGAKFGSLVHAVLENADPFAPDLAAELEATIREHLVWWPVDVPPEDLAAAMVPMHDTPLGPLADGVTLRQIGLADRMREMEFEFPLAGGDLRTSAPDIRLEHVGALLAEHLPDDDPLRVYADRLQGPGLGRQPLKGYLSGSVDAVLRLGDRYLVVDYKTNWLGDPTRPLTAADYARPRLVEAMLHSDYPLQALLYSVVLHRFLRWRLRGYSPDHHLGGVLYLFLRGMCGPSTPVVDGHPAGVFSWQPPEELIVALSDLLDAGRVAA